LIFQGEYFVEELFFLGFVLVFGGGGFCLVLVSDSCDFLEEFGDLEIFFGYDCVGFGELALEEGDAVLIAGGVVFFGVDVFEGGDHLLSFAFELFPPVIFQPLLEVLNF
jgi:hypothetical protein